MFNMFGPGGPGQSGRGGQSGNSDGNGQGAGGNFDPFGLFGMGAGGGNGGGRPAGASGPRPPRPELPKINWRKVGPVGITLLVLGGLVGFVYLSSIIWTEILWYRQLGAQRVLFTGWGMSAAMFVLFTLVAWAILALNFSLAYRFRPSIGSLPVDMRGYANNVARHSKLMRFGLPLVLALFPGISAASNWQQALLFFTGGDFGKKDPQFGFDVSFFVFKLPLIDQLITYLSGLVILSFLFTLGLYYLVGGIRFAQKFKATRAAHIHLGLLLALGSVLVGVGYYVDRFTLVYGTGSPVDGATYTQVNAVLPARTILAVTAFIIAALFVYAAFKGGWYLPVAGIAVSVVAALVVGMAYPALVQNFRVRPNERELEAPYIERNIKATLEAFNLDNLELIPYDSVTSETSNGQLRHDADSTQQIRLLDPDVIAPAARQLQQSRPYYSFPNQFSVDRYTFKKADGTSEKRDTVIAVRDINLDGLAPAQRNWVNDHTVYTHGFGVVAAYGNQVTSEGLPVFWESALSDQDSGELGDYEKRVYFSKYSPSYSIVGGPKDMKPHELNYADAKNNRQVYTTFDGDGGPSIGNFWNKLLYAVKFASTDIFFAQQVNAKSQILYYRDPEERVAKVAPYLTLDSRAYPAVVNMSDDPNAQKRIVWIIDAYTTTDSYPYAQHVDLAKATADAATPRADLVGLHKHINYMRNSVKAVVDAYDGKVTLYEWDQKDPILKAWQKIYPGQVQPLSKISADLMSHLRYPEDIFKVQRSLLSNYHVQNPGEFYTGGDQWKLSEDPTSESRGLDGSGPLQPPYYLTMKMPAGKGSQEAGAEFSLTSVFIPGGEGKRAAMAGFLGVDSETGGEAGKVREDYGKLRLLALPSDTTVPGPGQMQNNFNSDPTVSRELNIQNQQNSKVIRANLLTLPVGGGLLYVQPVYIQSTGTTQYPQLRSVLVGFGDKIGFAPTLKEALDQVFGGDSGAVTAGETEKEQQAASSADTAPAAGQTSTEAELRQALREAKKAIDRSQEALKSADWKAYGEAQTALNRALEKALNLQEGQESKTETAAQ